MTKPIKLTNEDIPAVLEYIKDEPEVNLFIEGDIELYGLESEVVTLWAFGEQWDCLLLKYYSNFMVSSKNETVDTLPIAEFLKDYNMQVISGKESLVRQLLPHYPSRSVQGTYLCRLRKEDLVPFHHEKLDIKQLQASDAQAIVDLYKLIEEFARLYRDREEEKLQQTYDNYMKGCLGYGLFVQGKLICTAYNTATTSSGAMIVGVATHPDHRMKGYASHVMSVLCQESFEAGLSFLCLFYDNPLAGKIYHRLGFQTIGRWGMLKF